MPHTHEVRILIGSDNWQTLLARLWVVMMELPPQGDNMHRTGTGSDGVTYAVDVEKNA